MKRRDFMKLLGLGTAAGAVAYFDMGASWKRHEEHFYYRDTPIVVDPYVGEDRLFVVEDAEKILKAYYDESVVKNLTYKNKPLFDGLPHRKEVSALVMSPSNEKRLRRNLRRKGYPV